MPDVTGRLKDILDSWPVIAAFVTTVQSAVVKAFGWVSPRFATLKPWAKIATLFLLGFVVYKLILGLGWLESLVFSIAGTAAAAVIYYFGRMNPVPPQTIRRTPRTRRPLGHRPSDPVRRPDGVNRSTSPGTPSPDE